MFSSTCAVYGTPRTLPVDEQHPTGPESPYGESKRIVEQMLHWFDECHGMRSVALRYFNAAGASADARIGEDNPRPLNLVPLAMQAALGQLRVLPINGTDYPTPDGTTIRDYVHVDDLAAAHVRALHYLEAGGDSTIVNVGTGRGASTLEVIEGAKRVSGVDFATAPAPRRPVTRRRCSPTTGVRASCWAGNRSTTSTTSSRARGGGTPRTRMATARAGECGAARSAPRRVRRTGDGRAERRDRRACATS